MGILLLGLMLVSSSFTAFIGANQWFELCNSPDDTTKQITEMISKQPKPAARLVLNLQHHETQQTCLMTACLLGKTKQIFTLLRLGADPTVPEKDGYTCWHGIAYQGRDKTAAKLLKFLEQDRDLTDHYPSFNPGRKHKDGFSPFQRTLWRSDSPRHLLTAKVLLDSGFVDEKEVQNALKQHEASIRRLSEEQVALLKTWQTSPKKTPFRTRFPTQVQEPKWSDL